MICQNCGKEISEGSPFCIHCGTAVPGAVTPNAEQAAAQAAEQAAVAQETAAQAVEQAAEAPTASFGDAAAAAAAAAPVASQADQPQAGYAPPAQPQAGYAPPAPPQDPYGQQAGAQGAYAQPTPPQYQQGGSDPGTAPMVMGILSIVLALLIPVLGAIAGIVLGALGISKGSKVLKENPENGRAKGGKITGIIGLILSILSLIATIFLTAVLGIMITEVAENPDAALEILEQAASEDETGELQELVDELKQSSELNSGGAVDSQGTSAAPTSEAPASADPTSEAPAGVAPDAAEEPKDYSGGEAFDSWAPECLNDAKQPTLYAITELKGWQLETLLQQQGFEWFEGGNAWLRSSDDMVYYMYGPSGSLTDDEIALGDKGGVGTRALHVLEASGFASARDALEKLGNVTTEDVYFPDGDDFGMAVVYGPSMKEYLVVVESYSEEEGGYCDMFVFSDEAIEAGMFDYAYGEDGNGNSISEVWQTLTGGAVGDQVQNNQ